MKNTSMSILFLGLYFLCDFSSSQLFAENSKETPLEKPWLTGPILAPAPYTPGAGLQIYQPYIYYTKQQRTYNDDWHAEPSSHFDTLLLKPIFKFGITRRTELDVTPQLLYQNSKGQHFWRIGDLATSLCIQLLNDNTFVNFSRPDIKLRVGATIPIGKYDRLNPNKHNIDDGGAGSWAPLIGLDTGKFCHFNNINWLVTRLAFTCVFGSKVTVHGVNYYGGDEKTKGKVYPGNSFTTNLGLEATLARNWALALDLQYEHQNKTKFFGKSGGTSPKKAASELFTVAPGIEYNYSSRLGAIFGPSITFAGRNGAQSITWVLALNIQAGT